MVDHRTDFQRAAVAFPSKTHERRAFLQHNQSVTMATRGFRQPAQCRIMALLTGRKRSGGKKCDAPTGWKQFDCLWSRQADIVVERAKELWRGRGDGESNELGPWSRCARTELPQGSGRQIEGRDMQFAVRQEVIPGLGVNWLRVLANWNAVATCAGQD